MLRLARFCLERDRLEQVYKRRIRAYAVARETQEGVTPNESPEYRQIQTKKSEARLNTEVARVQLENHRQRCPNCRRQ